METKSGALNMNIRARQMTKLLLRIDKYNLCKILKKWLICCLLVFTSNWSLAQLCPPGAPIPRDSCGQITPSFSSGNISDFCIGQTVSVQTETVIPVDTIFICWGDGTIDTTSTNLLTNTFYHQYTYKKNECLSSGDPYRTVNVVASFIKHCGNEYSYRNIGTTYVLRLQANAAFHFSNNPVCVGEQFSLFKDSCDNSATAINNWYLDGVLYFTGTNPPPYAFPPGSSGAHVWKLVITGNSCGNDSITHTMNVLPSATINPSITTNDYCIPVGPLTTVLNGNNIDSAHWTTSPTTGVLINPTLDSIPQISFDSAGTYYIYTEGFDRCCTFAPSVCHDTDTVIIYKKPLLTLSPSLPDTFCAQQVQINPLNYFHITDDDDSTVVSWNITNGSPLTASGLIPGNFTFDNSLNPPPYIISVTVHHPCGDSTISDTLSILPPTIVNPTYTIPDCAPDTFQVSANAVNASAYTWTTTGIPAITVTSPNNSSSSFITSASGNYQVLLHADGCCTAPTSDCDWDTTLSFTKNPVITLTNAISPICVNGSFNPYTYFSFDTLNSNASGIQWYLPGGSITSSSLYNPGNISYPVAGNYPVTVTIYSATCDSATLIDTIVVNTAPVLQVSSGNLIGCDTITVAFSNLNPSYIHNWNAGGGTFISGTTASSTNPIIYFTSPPFNYTVSVFDSVPGCPATTSQSFTVSLYKAPDLNLTGNNPDGCDTNYIINFNNIFQFTPDLINDSAYQFTITLNGISIFNSYQTINPALPANYAISDTGLYIVSATAYSRYCGNVIIADTFHISLRATIILASDTCLCRHSGALNLNSIVSPLTGIWIPSSTINPAISPLNNQYIYTYGAGDCEVSDTINLTVVGADVYAGNDTTICANQGTINFNGSHPGTWNAVYGSITGTGVYTPPAISVVTDTVSLTVNESFSICNCTTTDTLIVIYNSPSSAAVAIPDNGCINSPIAFNNPDPSAGTTSWYFGDGNSVLSNNNTSHLYTDTGTYHILIVFANASQCTDTLKDSIYIDKPPIANITAFPSASCEPDTVIITNIGLASNSAATSYYWDFDNGLTSTQSQPDTIIYNNISGDSTVYSIILTDSNYCGVASDTAVIIVYPIPIADFYPDQDTICSTEIVCFSSIVTGAPDSYQWHLNGSLYSTDSVLACQPFFTGLLDSIIEIKYIVTNECGSDTVVRLLTIKPSVVNAFFNIGTDNGCVPFTVNFTSSITANATVNWIFGDGGIFCCGYNTQYTYDTAGIFTVQQIVDNVCGRDTAFDTITVFPQANVLFSTSNLPLCSNDSVQFFNTSSSLAGLIWDFGDGSTDSSTWDPYHFYNPGNYNVTLIGYGSGTGNCPDTLTQSITIVDIPHPEFSAGPINVCIGNPIQLTNIPSCNCLYQWNMGNGSTLSGTTTSYIYPDTGFYAVTLFAIDNTTNCDNDTTFYGINVRPEPIADFSIIQNPTCVVPATVLGTDLSISDYPISHNWTFGNYSSASTNPVFTGVTQGNYIASLYVENIYGCFDSISKSLQITGAPVVDFEADSAKACIGTEINFNNYTTNANQYLWYFGDGTSSNSFSQGHVYDSSGYYTVTLVASNIGGCSDSLTLTNYINILPLPMAHFAVDTITTGTYQFIDSSLHAIEWDWDFDDGSAHSAIPDPRHTYYINGTVTVELIVTDANGCTDNETAVLYINRPGTLFLPNALTPGSGDKEHRLFIPKGIDVAEFHIKIYSPLGQLVWYCDDPTFIEGISQCQWDGTDIFTGNDLPQGTYTWVLSKTKYRNNEGALNLTNNNSLPNGTVTLIR